MCDMVALLQLYHGNATARQLWDVGASCLIDTPSQAKLEIDDVDVHFSHPRKKDYRASGQSVRNLLREVKMLLSFCKHFACAGCLQGDYSWLCISCGEADSKSNEWLKNLG